MSEQKTTADRIVDYISRDPVLLSNVRSHFGLSREAALAHLVALEGQGRIEEFGGAIRMWRLPNHA